MWTKQHSRGGSWPPCILCEGGDEHADDEHGDDEHGDDDVEMMTMVVAMMISNSLSINVDW